MDEAYPGSRHCLREAFRLKGLPESSLEVVTASITTSTLKQYNYGLKLWWQFCKETNNTFYGSSITVIVDFLSKVYQNGGSYGTLNCIRSALSLLMSPEVGNDYRIKRFLKGVIHLRPPRPKYNYTWDPTIVLNYLDNFYPNENLTLQVLSEKLVGLLALITAHRVQTLASILIQNIRPTSFGVEILISDRIKTTNINVEQPVLVLPNFNQKPSLCAANTLRTYLSKTQVLRPSGNGKLFITYKKPHHPASAQTISRWIKSLLSKSGIDTSVFTAHSTRHAATSAASRRGVSLDIIRSTAGWSHQSAVFAQFYNKPLTNRTAFANTILNLTEK